MDTPFLQLSEKEEELLRTFLLILRKLLGGPVAAATSPTPSAKLLDPAASMRLLNISRATLYRLKKAGVLTPARIGGHDYYLETEIRNFFKT